MSNCTLFPPTFALSASDRLYSRKACGISGNSTIYPNFRSCCSVDSPPATADGCWGWCAYNGTLQEFTNCVLNGTSNSVQSGLTFCQGVPAVVLTANMACPARQTNAGASTKKPALSILMTVLLCSMFITGTVASPLDSLASMLLPRQSIDQSTMAVNTTCGQGISTCTSFVPSNGSFTKTQSQRIIGVQPCRAPPCYINVTIDADTPAGGPIHLNRTLNQYSATNATYDNLFGVIAKAMGGADAGWAFLASTSYQNTYEYYATMDTFLNVFWILKCVTGVVDGCNAGIGISNGTQVEACEVISSDGERGLGLPGASLAGRTPKLYFNVVQSS